MSREIKFRAWIYDRLNKKGQLYYAKDWSGGSGALLMYFEEHCVEGEDFLEQFTGLKDKNGKEIYEGDILRYERSKMLGVVVYNIDKFSLQVKTPKGLRWYGMWERYDEIDGLNPCLDEHEVIGNIHENKELLDAEKTVE